MLGTTIGCAGITTVLAVNAFAAENEIALTQAESGSNYDLHYIGVDATGSRWTAYEGKLKTPLERPDFYEKIGREDLSAAYRSRSNLKLSLEVLGGTALALGSIYAAISFDSRGPCVPPAPIRGDCWDQQLPHDKVPQGFIGLGVALVGAGLLTWGIFMNPDPIDSPRAKQLADDYNERLKAKLGNPDALAPSPTETPKIQVAIEPVISRSGGGMALGISF